MIVAMISFIVPAHNEEALLPATLTALFTAASAIGRPFEVIVADDASTDRTAEVAQCAGARVAKVNLRKISAVRNAGARAASGDILFFIDADTLVSQTTLRAALQALEAGAVGGGAPIRLDDNAPAWGRAITWIIAQVWFRMRWAAGCFVFVRREIFDRVGGFDEQYFLGEEMYLSKALKREGKFVIVRHPVLTSARKFRTYSPRDLTVALLTLLGKGTESWKTRDAARWWYEGRREASIVSRDDAA